MILCSRMGLLEVLTSPPLVPDNFSARAVPAEPSDGCLAAAYV